MRKRITLFGIHSIPALENEIERGRQRLRLLADARRRARRPARFTRLVPAPDDAVFRIALALFLRRRDVAHFSADPDLQDMATLGIHRFRDHRPRFRRIDPDRWHRWTRRIFPLWRIRKRFPDFVENFDAWWRGEYLPGAVPPYWKYLFGTTHGLDIVIAAELARGCPPARVLSRLSNTAQSNAYRMMHVLSRYAPDRTPVPAFPETRWLERGIALVEGHVEIVPLPGTGVRIRIRKPPSEVHHALLTQNQA